MTHAVFVECIFAQYIMVYELPSARAVRHSFCSDVLRHVHGANKGATRHIIDAVGGYNEDMRGLSLPQLYLNVQFLAKEVLLYVRHAYSRRILPAVSAVWHSSSTVNRTERVVCARIGRKTPFSGSRVRQSNV